MRLGLALLAGLLLLSLGGCRRQSAPQEEPLPAVSDSYYSVNQQDLYGTWIGAVCTENDLDPRSGGEALAEQPFFILASIAPGQPEIKAKSRQETGTFTVTQTFANGKLFSDFSENSDSIRFSLSPRSSDEPPRIEVFSREGDLAAGVQSRLGLLSWVKLPWILLDPGLKQNPQLDQYPDWDYRHAPSPAVVRARRMVRPYPLFNVSKDALGGWMATLGNGQRPRTLPVRLFRHPGADLAQWAARHPSICKGQEYKEYDLWE